MAQKIAFFDAKPYDEQYFNQANKQKGFEIKYFKDHLNKDNAVFTKGFDAVCVFVNDQITEEVIEALYQNGIKLIALKAYHCFYKKIHQLT